MTLHTVQMPDFVLDIWFRTFDAATAAAKLGEKVQANDGQTGRLTSQVPCRSQHHHRRRLRGAVKVTHRYVLLHHYNIITKFCPVRLFLCSQLLSHLPPSPLSINFLPLSLSETAHMVCLGRRSDRNLSLPSAAAWKFSIPFSYRTQSTIARESPQHHHHGNNGC